MGEIHQLRNKKVATATTDIVSIALPAGVTIRHVNVKNDTNFWRKISINLAKSGASATEATEISLSLVNAQIQCGDKAIKWQGEITLGHETRNVCAVFHTCSIGDVLTLSVGYEP